MTRILSRHLLSTASVLLCLGAPPVHAGTTDWSAWAYHLQVSVRNNDAGPLPAGYTTKAILDTSTLIALGRMRADCADLRASFDDGASESELDRVVEGCGSSSTRVLFGTRAAVAAGASDSRYRLYWGSPAAANPPANPAGVYLFFDDFQDGNANGWNPAEGSWSVVNDGGNYVYRYSSGGSQWVLSSRDLPESSDLEYSARIRASDDPFSTRFIGLGFRIQDPSDFLTFYESRDVNQFKLARVVADSHTLVQFPPFTMTADTWYRVRVQAVGTQIRGKIWQDGTPEPGAWLISAAESTYQANAGVGLTVYKTGSVKADWDDVQVRKLVSMEPTVSAFDASSWTYHTSLWVKNNAAMPLPTGYTIQNVLDTASLIAQGRMRADCEDLRVTFNDGRAEIEQDRLVEGCNTSSTTVTLSTQETVAPGATDTYYRLHWGNPSAVDPPVDPGRVYLFYDDFQDGDAGGWTPAEGRWEVVDDGGNAIYRYSGLGSKWVVSSVSLPGNSDIEYSARIRAGSPLVTPMGLALRIQDPSNFLTSYESFDPDQFHFARIKQDNHTITQSPSYTLPRDTWHRIRMQAVGNRIRAKIWPDGTQEPSGWLIDILESEYQPNTGIGAAAYGRTNAKADWDDIHVRKLLENEPTVFLHQDPPSWWNTAWGYRERVTVENGSSTFGLPAGYAVRARLDTAALIAAGKVLATCEDLRVIAFDGSSNTEIDRVVEGCGSASTEVWFVIRRDIRPLTADDSYLVYYGNPVAGPAPADGMKVFPFYENWEGGVNHWTGAGGLDPTASGSMGRSTIVSDASFSPTHSQKFTSKSKAPGAFSGLIPVTPSTRYAIQIWGRSASAAYGPVGYDLYSAAKVKKPGAMLWSTEWLAGPQWSGQGAAFTTATDTAYLKVKSHWSKKKKKGTKSKPLYLDDIALRYALPDEPSVATGLERTFRVPIITDIRDSGPIEVRRPVSVSARVFSTHGNITAVTLKVLSPETAAVPMTLTEGNDLAGTWRASFTPPSGGDYDYSILAQSSDGQSSESDRRIFTSSDTHLPQIALASVSDPLLVRDTQTLIVKVTDDGLVKSVSVLENGNTHPMTPEGGDTYSASWSVTDVGSNAYLVTATDTADNSASLPGSFQSLARDVDVCTWRGCKQGAASWSIDDGHADCFDALAAAGFKGTYYVIGSVTQPWYSTYGAAGHEIACHTVSHPCTEPCCYPTCTPGDLLECPTITPAVNAFRRDELDPNIRAIESGTGRPTVSAAWPCGATDPDRMLASSFYHIGTRGFFDTTVNLYWIQDVNGRTPAEFQNLMSANTYSQIFIDRAIDEGKWAIITSHGSCSGISHMGSRSDALWLAPVGEVLEYIRVRDAATFTNYRRAGGAISFDAAHGLPVFERRQLDGTPLLSIRFDNLVTLNVKLEPSDEVMGVTVDGLPVSYSVVTGASQRYLLVETSLDVARHVIVTLN